MRTRFFLSLILALTMLCGTVATRATAQDAGPTQQSDLSPQEIAELGEAGPIVKELRPQRDKTVVLIFDVSGSMKSDNMLRRARQAALRVVRYGVRPGDTVAVYTFGAGYDSVVETIGKTGEKGQIIDAIPSTTREGAGTNIRHPHHDALKEIARQQNNFNAIVVLTDSFNDEPKKTDPAYSDYTRYYVPGQLTKYPKTPENADYERLLQEWVVSGKVRQYGIGVGFAETGRPIERLPRAAEIPAAPRQTPSAPPPVTKPPEETSPVLWIVGGVVGLGLLALAGWLLSSAKPMPLRITGGPNGNKDRKDFQVRGGQPIRIGGEGAKFAPDAYPLPELRQPAALVRLGRGGLVIAPPATEKPATPEAKPVPGNEKGQVRVLHNGIALEGETPLRYGDEIRITIPPASGVGSPKEYRLRFDDPKRI